MSFAKYSYLQPSQRSTSNVRKESVTIDTSGLAILPLVLTSTRETVLIFSQFIRCIEQFSVFHIYRLNKHTVRCYLIDSVREYRGEPEIQISFTAIFHANFAKLTRKK